MRSHRVHASGGRAGAVRPAARRARSRSSSCAIVLRLWCRPHSACRLSGRRSRRRARARRGRTPTSRPRSSWHSAHRHCARTPTSRFMCADTRRTRGGICRDALCWYDDGGGEGKRSDATFRWFRACTRGWPRRRRERRPRRGDVSQRRARGRRTGGAAPQRVVGGAAQQLHSRAAARRAAGRATCARSRAWPRTRRPWRLPGGTPPFFCHAYGTHTHTHTNVAVASSAVTRSSAVARSSVARRAAVTRKVATKRSRRSRGSIPCKEVSDLMKTHCSTELKEYCTSELSDLLGILVDYGFWDDLVEILKKILNTQGPIEPIVPPLIIDRPPPNESPKGRPSSAPSTPGSTGFDDDVGDDDVGNDYSTETSYRGVVKKLALQVLKKILSITRRDPLKLAFRVMSQDEGVRIISHFIYGLYGVDPNKPIAYTHSLTINDGVVTFDIHQASPPGKTRSQGPANPRYIGRFDEVFETVDVDEIFDQFRKEQQRSGSS